MFSLILTALLKPLGLYLRTKICILETILWTIKHRISGYLLVSQDLIRLIEDVPETPWPISCKRKITGHFYGAINFSRLADELKKPRWECNVDTVTYKTTTSVLSLLPCRSEENAYVIKSVKVSSKLSFFWTSLGEDSWVTIRVRGNSAMGNLRKSLTRDFLFSRKN